VKPRRAAGKNTRHSTGNVAPTIASSSRIPGYLLVLLMVYGVASLIHFAHNAEFVFDYPHSPAWLTRSAV